MERKTKNSIFWTPEYSASSRRNWEKRNNKNYSFVWDGHEYYVEHYAHMSCKNVYTRLIVEKDGEAKDIRILKSIIKNPRFLLFLNN